MSLSEKILGPKIPAAELDAHWTRYQWPRYMFVLAQGLLVISIFLPYWQLQLLAPQYPEGLYVRAYINRLEGETVENVNSLKELTELNHYVGMKPFDDGAKFERSVAILAMIAIAGVLAAAGEFRSRRVVLFTLPALAWPFIFLADLQYWLWNYGHSLDPRAPLSSTVKPFTPPVLGPATIANFDVLALPSWGLWLALISSGLIGTGLVLHRRAFKPLVEAARGHDDGEEGAEDRQAAKPDSENAPDGDAKSDAQPEVAASVGSDEEQAPPGAGASDGIP